MCPRSKPAPGRQSSDQILGDPIGKIFLCRIARHVAEREDRHGGPDQYLFRRRNAGTCVVEADIVDGDRLIDILQLPLAQRHKALRNLVAGMTYHRVRNDDAAGLGELLQPRRDVDAVAKDVLAIQDDVADVNADACASRIGITRNSNSVTASK